MLRSRCVTRSEWSAQDSASAIEFHREAQRKGLKHYLATDEGRIIDKHTDKLIAIRKGGEAFPVELTVRPVAVAGEQIFCGFLRDLSERDRSETAPEPQRDSSQP